jgi:AraC-like DNA-binding protein
MAEPAASMYFSEERFHVFDACSAASPPSALTGLSLETIWHVDADRTYDVRCGPRTGPRLVVVRTLDGEGHIALKTGYETALRPGVVLVVRWSDIARYLCTAPRWHFYWFELTSAGALPLPVATAVEVPALPREARELGTAFTKLRSESVAERRVASATLLYLLCRWGAACQDEKGSRPYETEIAAVIQRMHADLGGSLSLADMARVAGVSDRRFRHVFARVTGQAPKQFYDGLRLEHGRRLLELGIYNVSDVGERLGYSSPFHFSRAFARRFGLPPSKVRPR